MTKAWNRRMLLISILLLIVVIAATPVAATTVKIDLNKTYVFKNTHLSTIKTLDLGDPSVSKVEVLTTTGDGSDVRVLQQPNILKITRDFSGNEGMYMGNKVTVEGDLYSTIDYTSRPDFRYYINSTIPTFKVTVPGYTGNPFATKYNESWKKQDAALFQAATAMYLYNGTGIGYTDGVNDWFVGGTFANAPVNKNDINYTLFNNRVSINPYTADATTDWNFGDNNPEALAGTGKYFAGALSHNDGTETATIYALSPVVVLKKETPISWTDDYGTYKLPMTYVKGENGNVTLKFPNADAATTPTKIGYVFINSTAQYNLMVKINTSLLADNTNSQWQSLSPSSHIIEVLYEGILNDVGAPFTYNLTAVGQPNATDAMSYSQIAISKGYGMSGKVSDNKVTILSSAFAGLNNGVYYVYLMGVNNDNDIVALSQGTVSITSGSNAEPVAPTVSGILPPTGTRNSTVTFTVSGTNFPTAFGTSGVIVNLTCGGTTIPTNITSVTSTKITGSFITGKAPLGKYNVELFTNDAGIAVKEQAFTIGKTNDPTIGKITPASPWYTNSTVNYTITGTNFVDGATTIVIQNKSVGGKLNESTRYGVWAVTPTAIYGTIFITDNTSTATTFNISVYTVDSGKTVKMDPAFTLKTGLTPANVAITPTSGNVNSTVSFSITGQNFRPENGYTLVTFVNSFSGVTYTAALTSVTSTKITGTLTIPNTASSGDYDVVVTTVDGGSFTKEGGFTFNALGLPAITSVNQSSGYRNTTVAFKVLGSNFQSGTSATAVLFLNPITGSKLNAAVLTATSTQIEGTLTIPATATGGAYDLVVMTADGGYSTKAGTFTIKVLPAPTLGTMNVSTGYKNNTYYFTLPGSNFQTDSGTFMRLYQPGAAAIPCDLSTVSAGKLTGSFTIPYNAASGKYRIDVLTVSGGSASKFNAFTVSCISAPAVQTITPPIVYENTTVTFTIKGSYFQPNGGTNVTLFHPTGPISINPSALSINSPSQITATFKIPANAPTTAKWMMNVTTVEGKLYSKPNAITVNQYGLPAFQGITPDTGYRNTTVAFTLTGTDFQEQGTNVTFQNLTATKKTLVTTIYSISPKQIIGSVVVPTNAGPKYSINISTVDGGQKMNDNKFTVKDMPKVDTTKLSMYPTSIAAGTTVPFTLSGNYFQPQGGTEVTFRNITTGAKITAVVQTAAINRITGTIAVPAGTSPGGWSINITTVDAGWSNKTKFLATT